MLTTQMFVTPLELTSVSLSESIQEGTVAIGISGSGVGSAGGFIRPGDKINLVASDTVDLTQTLQFLTDPALRQLLSDAGFIVPFADLVLPDVVETPGFPVAPIDPSVPVEEPTNPLLAFVGTLTPSFSFTQTVMQNLEVLAVGSDTRPAPLGTGLTPQGGQTFVLEVTFEQAEKLQFIQNNTSFAFMLLPSEFPYTIKESRGVVIDDIFDVVSRLEEQLEAAFGG